MYKVCVLTTNRADTGLTAPVMKRIKEHPKMKLIVLDARGREDSTTVLDSLSEKPDLMLVTGDRKEMLQIALEAFSDGIPITHMDAGERNVGGSRDDQYRWMMTMMADLIFCNTKQMSFNVFEFLTALRMEAKVHTVGYTCFDDMEVDDSLCPEEAYDMVLYNMPMYVSDVHRDLTNIVTILDKKTVWIHPSDKDKEILGWMNNHPFFGSGKVGHGIVQYKDLPRPQFLALLKNCSRFIGNSSAQFHEARFFNKTCINVGARNSNRNPALGIDMKPGASDRIVGLIKEWLDGRKK